MPTEFIFDKVTIVQSVLAWFVAPIGFLYSESWILLLAIAIAIFIAGVFCIVRLFRDNNGRVVKASGGISILTMTSFNAFFALPLATAMCHFFFGVSGAPVPG